MTTIENMKGILNIPKAPILFGLLLLVFSVCYWSFFPGAYTVDSYVSYLNAVGLLPYGDFFPPMMSLYWSLLNNYNFGPFLINYLVFIAALFLSIRFTKGYLIAIFSLIGICMPYTLVTFIFAWKDNALMSILFLLAVLCLDRRNRSAWYGWVVIAVFFFAFSLRLNAVFAIIPLLFYFLLTKFGLLRSVALSAAVIVGFFALNGGLNKFVFDAQPGNSDQPQFYTDIVKMNRAEGRNIVEDIPEPFIKHAGVTDENVTKLFEVYADFSCNDIFYMHPEWNGARSILSSTADRDAVAQLRANWLRRVAGSPLTYAAVRSRQLDNALWSTNLLYEPSFIHFDEALCSRIIGRDVSAELSGQRSKIFVPSENQTVVSVREFFAQKSSYLDLVSYPGVYLVLSIFIFAGFLIKRNTNPYFRVGMFVSASGLFHTLGYFPILPCTDYRYFVWTIFAFWLSVGVFAAAAALGPEPDRGGAERE